MADFSDEVVAVLRAAGWVPGRQVDPGPWIAQLENSGLNAHQAAEEFLVEFGGLVVDISGSGVTRAREPFALDPLQCLGEEDRFLEWGTDIGRMLFPVGILNAGQFFLAIDEMSTIYVVETWLGSFGGMPEAMENLILGIRPTVIEVEDSW